MDRLVKQRKARGLTQVELGDAVGIDSNTISRYETGKLTPSLEALQKLANYFNVSVDELLNGPAPNEIEIRVIIEETNNWEVEKLNLTDGGPSTFSIHIGPSKVGVYVCGKFDGPGDLDDVFARARKAADKALSDKDGYVELGKGEA